MRDLLYLAHRIPYPPDKGDKIRSWHVLRHLAQRWRVHLGCFVDDAADWRHRGALEAICGECCFVPLDRRRATLRSLPGLAGSEPLTVPYYRSARLMRWVEDIVRRRAPEAIAVFSSSMAQYAFAPGLPPARRIVDFVDVDSDKWRQYAERKGWPARLVYAREARQLLAYERRIAAAADAAVFVSAAEAALFARLAPEAAGRVHGIGNGVDSAYFSPERACDSPFAADAPAIVFTGAMDYWANADAVSFFAREAMPLILAGAPLTRFWIVGGNPSPEVRRLAALPGVSVTGRVPDVRPYLAHARAVVAPLRVARGVQNKVLEAMAMARPVVASPEALEGLALQAGREALRADGAAAFAAAVLPLLHGDGGGLGARARARVVAHYGWDSSLAAFDRLIEPEAEPPRLRAAS